MPLGIVEQHTCQDNWYDGELWFSDSPLSREEIYVAGVGHGESGSNVPWVLQRTIAREYCLSRTVWPEEE